MQTSIRCQPHAHANCFGVIGLPRGRSIRYINDVALVAKLAVQHFTNRLLAPGRIKTLIGDEVSKWKGGGKSSSPACAGGSRTAAKTDVIPSRDAV